MFYFMIILSELLSFKCVNTDTIWYPVNTSMLCTTLTQHLVEMTQNDLCLLHKKK